MTSNPGVSSLPVGRALQEGRRKASFIDAQDGAHVRAGVQKAPT